LLILAVVWALLVQALQLCLDVVVIVIVFITILIASAKTINCTTLGSKLLARALFKLLLVVVGGLFCRLFLLLQLLLVLFSEILVLFNLIKIFTVLEIVLRVVVIASFGLLVRIIILCNSHFLIFIRLTFQTSVLVLRLEVRVAQLKLLWRTALRSALPGGTLGSLSLLETIFNKFDQDIVLHPVW